MSKSTSSSQDPSEAAFAIIDYIKKESKIDADVLIKKINDNDDEFKFPSGKVLLVMNTLAKKESSAISKEDFVKILNGIELKDDANRTKDDVNIFKDRLKESCISLLFKERISEINISDAEKMIEGLEIKDAKVNSSIMDYYKRRLDEQPNPLKEGIKALEDARANFASMVQNGNTYLHIAAEMGRTDIIKLLFNGGENVNAQNKYGSTPIFYAAVTNQDQAIIDLIELEANVNARDNGGKTALFDANPLGEGIKALIKAGADVNAVDKEGKTPLHYSGNYLTKEIIALIELGADVHALDKKGNTPLHLAANTISDNSENIIALIELGANVNSLNKEGNTPLHLAASQDGYIKTAKALLENGANVNAENDKGETPLNVVSKNLFRIKKAPQMVELLLNHGAELEEEVYEKLSRLREVNKIIDDFRKEKPEANIKSREGSSPDQLAEKLVGSSKEKNDGGRQT